jgi:hypothetical protein
MVIKNQWNHEYVRFNSVENKLWGLDLSHGCADGTAWFVPHQFLPMPQNANHVDSIVIKNPYQSENKNGHRESRFLMAFEGS